MVPFLSWLAFVAVAEGIGMVGGIATAPEIRGWYAGLKKPAWNPPSWIFAPVWTTLYLLMGTAAWMAWREVGFQGFWVTPYAIQLLLNLAWSFVFFRFHRIGWAFVELVAMWIAIVATMLAFSVVGILPVLLLVPYLGWVTFAGFLNFTLWRMNRHTGVRATQA